MVMGASSTLAKTLDQQMLDRNSVHIAARTVKTEHLPRKTGLDVAREIGGRLLLRYLLLHQVGQYTGGSPAVHFVTPTPYSSEETVSWLFLPKATEPRTHVLLLDPGKVDVIAGPRWVILGKGIEYILPNGFPKEAVIGGWEMVVD